MQHHHHHTEYITEGVHDSVGLRVDGADPPICSAGGADPPICSAGGAVMVVFYWIFLFNNCNDGVEREYNVYY